MEWNNMKDLNYKIATMYRGGKEEILKGIYDEKQIIVVNAIIAGTQQKIRDDAFVDQLNQIADDFETKMLNIPLSFFAIAALDILGIKTYNGDDEHIKIMIDSKFSF